MHYKSYFSISFDADNDATALRVARTHHAQIVDELQVEGADHPHEITFEQLKELDSTTDRAVPIEPTTRAI